MRYNRGRKNKMVWKQLRQEEFELKEEIKEESINSLKKTILLWGFVKRYRRSMENNNNRSKRQYQFW